MTNSERKHDNFTNDPIFSSTLSSLSVCTFHFCISGPWKFSSMRSPFALSSGLQNTLSHAKDDTLKPAGIYIFFLQKVCKLLVYNMFCSQYDNKLTPIPWTKLNLRKKIIWCEARNWKPYKRFVLSQNFLYWFGNCSSKKLLNCSVWQEPWEFKKCHVWVCVSYLHPQFLPLMCLFVTSYEFLIFRHWNVSMIHYFVTNIFKGISRLLLLYYDLCKYLKDSNGNEK